MAINEIKPADIVNKGVIGLADVPGLTTAEMQKRMDELAKDVIIPKVNELVKGVNATNESLTEVEKKLITNFVSEKSLLSVSENGKYYTIGCSDLPPCGGNGMYGYLDVTAHNHEKEKYKVIRYTPVDVNELWQNVCLNGLWAGWVRLTTNSDLIKSKYVNSKIMASTTGYKYGDSTNKYRGVLSVSVPEGGTEIIAAIPLMAYQSADASKHAPCEGSADSILVYSDTSAEYTVTYVILYK